MPSYCAAVCRDGGGRWGAGEAVTRDVTVTSSVTMSHSHARTFTWKTALPLSILLIQQSTHQHAKQST